MAERYLVRLGYELKELEVEEGPAGLRVLVDGNWHEARLEQVGSTSLYALIVDDRPHELFAAERADGYDIVIGWERYPVAVGTRGRRPSPAPPASQAPERAEAGGWVVLSPMTGVVFDLYVQAGDEVSEGDVLMVIEAMKMNNELRAQRAGTVSEVYVQKGQRVEQGSSMLVLV
ncbi:MAG TPA: biotin/lipoyl-containing protein [Dehalococcoidia bacterium]|nr:biotin/lipoyl-containing protein [Dehalococcoidia bacterium]